MPLRVLDGDVSTFTSKDLAAAATRIAAAMDAAAADLNAADGQLGDGDLGITVSKGWAEVASLHPPEDVGRAFLEASKAFQRVSSSSFGTLTATALMAAAKATKGADAVAYGEVSNLLTAARDAMMARGKGELGQKSVLDMLDALAAATDGIEDASLLRSAANEAAQQTLDTFRDRPAGLGRARMFGEKSKGLDDPGMKAASLLIAAL